MTAGQLLPVDEGQISNPQQLTQQLDYLVAGRRLRIGEYLLQRGSITHEQLAEGLRRKAEQPEKRLGEHLVELAALDPDEVEQALQCLMGIPRVDLSHFYIDSMALALVPEDVARQMQLIPLMLHRDDLVVACAQVPDATCLQMLSFTTSRNITVVLTEPEDIYDAISAHYDTVSESLAGSELVVEQSSSLQGDDTAVWREAEHQAHQQPIVRLVNSLIRDAIHRRASDIHIRPGRDVFQLLYRVDGSLITLKHVHKRLLPAVVSRIKILSGLNIAEHRLPQDGHMRVMEGHNLIDLRVSIIPMQHGESVVIRVLNKQQGLRSIHEIGFSPDDEEVFLDLINRSSGILLVTGPTGSGKTTTLYAALQEVKSEQINIITVEDPIEYELEGMRQIQLVEAIGFSFPQSLRAILRHDPDIIMIGEMRDQDTCKIALESALTGHLVFSTLHTNDAPSAIIRMQEMGMTPYLIKSALIGVVGQRLIRLNCQHCLEEEQVTPVIRRNAGVEPGEVFWHGVGCEHCHGTGYAGRAAIYEMFVINDYVRDRIHDHMSASELRQIAVESGMRPLLQHGLEYARERRASLTEVYRASV